MKAWPPPLNWASQAPGMALTSANALGAGNYYVFATRGDEGGHAQLTEPIAGAIAVPCVRRRSLPIHQVGRELRTRGGHNVAEFAVDGLGEIAGKQQGEQSASLLVRR